MSQKEFQIARPEVTTVVKVDWIDKKGFEVSSIEVVDKLPKDKLGVDTEKNSALVAIQRSPKGIVKIVGLDKIIRKPGTLAKEGRCTS